MKQDRVHLNFVCLFDVTHNFRLMIGSFARKSYVLAGVARLVYRAGAGRQTASLRKLDTHH